MNGRSKLLDCCTDEELRSTGKSREEILEGVIRSLFDELQCLQGIAARQNAALMDFHDEMDLEMEPEPQQPSWVGLGIAALIGHVIAKR